MSTDTLAKNIFGVLYSSLPTAEQADVTAAAAKAESRVEQYAQVFDFGDGTTAPDAWANWAEIEGELILARRHRTERIQSLRSLAEDAMEAAMTSYQTRAPNSSTVPVGTLSVLDIRKHVLTFGVKQRPRLFTDVLTVDNAIHEIVNQLWNQEKWVFRRRAVTMTIAANGTVTFDLPSGEAFDSFAVGEIYYTDGESMLQWANAERMAMLKSDSTTQAARPRLFRFEDRGSSRVYQFYPAPDQEYTAKCEVFISGPEFPEDEADTAWLDKFPSPFVPVIRDMVVARVFEGRLPSFAAIVSDRLDRLIDRYAERNGWIDKQQRPRDIYDDVNAAFGFDNPYGRAGGQI